MKIKRDISTIGLLFAAIGGIIGSGWLFGPFFAAKIAGPAAILSWIIGGSLMMVIALTFAELASTFPVTGGTAHFLELSHGTLVNFTMAWIAWLAATAVAPIETLALLNYATNYVPWLMRQENGVHLLTLKGMGVAAGLMLVLSAVNSLGANIFYKANNFVVTLKIIVPCLTILTLLFFSFHPQNWISNGFAPAGLKGILAALPTAGVIFSYIGYSPAIQLAGEAKNPQRAIPIAIIGALSVCIVLYVVLQFTFISALPSQSFANGWHQLQFSGDAGPFAGIAIIIGVLWLAYVLYFDAAVSPLGTAFVYTASSARLCYAMTLNRYLPEHFLKLNQHGVPTRILALNYIIGLILFLPFPTWQKMASFLVSAIVFAYAVGPLALVVLRRTMADKHRSFRVPVARIVCPIAFYISNLIVFWTGWQIVSKLLVTIIIGYILLLTYKNTRFGRHLNLQWRKAWWIFFYVGIMGLISYLGSFGGGIGVIPFGWDFLVIAIFSLIIFEIALYAATNHLR